MRLLLFVFGCIWGFQMIAIADEREENEREALVRCDLELLELEQQIQDRQLSELLRDERILEQQNTYRQLEQKRLDAEKQRRRQIEARWERDHARE